jgi:hypothetical protein
MCALPICPLSQIETAPSSLRQRMLSWPSNAGAGDVIRPVSNEVKVREMLQEQLFGSVLDRNRLIRRNDDDRIAIGIVGRVEKYVRQARKQRVIDVDLIGPKLKIHDCVVAKVRSEYEGIARRAAGKHGVAGRWCDRYCRRRDRWCDWL